MPPDLGPRDGFVSPRFGQPATFMRLPVVESAQGLDVALIGIPYDGGCSYRSGPATGLATFATSPR